MIEIFIGVASAVVFLAVWLIGGNFVISILSSTVCLIIAVFTIKALEKEKKLKIDLKSDENEYGKVRKSIIDFSSSISRYTDRYKSLNVEKDIILMMDSIHKTCLKISDALEEDNSLYTKLNDFSSYYFPGLINILDTYENLAEGSFKTDEAQKFASQFFLFLTQITDAFDKKYYSLFSKDVLDSKAEMAAMTAIFKSEGLVDNKDFMGGTI
ncbi:MAG TPA: 5-bromo-4-chloroindolyl phosphate hydrolase [Clostridiales bacterium]|nr:5-bromo-4-chloroindolyl phosphate hydrolase [Clostridiales bacterium]